MFLFNLFLFGADPSPAGPIYIVSAKEHLSTLSWDTICTNSAKFVFRYYLQHSFYYDFLRFLIRQFLYRFVTLIKSPSLVMGACFSKSSKSKPQTSDSLKNRTARVGQRVFEPAPQDDSRLAAARAAEQRFQAQETKNQTSQQKLKAMERVSKREKGLA